MMNYLDFITTIADFPKPGILFYDISPLLQDTQLRENLIADFAKALQAFDFDVIAGIDARGFIFGALLAQSLRKSFVMMRKPGKLPGAVWQSSYNLEYGDNSLCLQKSALQPGQRVLIIDDVLATGGTALAAIDLIKAADAVPVACACLLEIIHLNARLKLTEVATFSLLSV